MPSWTLSKGATPAQYCAAVMGTDKSAPGKASAGEGAADTPTPARFTRYQSQTSGVARGVEQLEAGAVTRPVGPPAMRTVRVGTAVVPVAPVGECKSPRVAPRPGHVTA